MRTDTLTKAAPSRQSGPRMSHGIYSRRFRHGVTWYIRYFIAGREVKERVGREADGFTKSKAKAALQSRLGDIAQGKFRLPTVRKPVLFRTLVARYREHAEAHHRGYRASRYTLNQLEAEFGTMPLADLSAFRIEKWKLARGKVVKLGTVNRDLNVLKAMLAKAVEWKLLDVNPARDVRRFTVNDARTRYLERAELAALLAAASRDVAAAWLVPAIMLAVHTGLRQGELLRLRWVDLSPTLDLATVPVTKNTDPKHVPLNADARAALAMLPRYGPTVLAWPWGDPLSDTTLYCAFVRVCRAAGITDFRWHDLRHTCASHLAMEGIDLHTVGTVLGHRDPKSTRRYAHLSRAHTAAAMDRLSERLAQPETPSAARAVAVMGAARAPATGPDLERNWNAIGGRQTPAKRDYLRSQRVGEWRRGESNPRPKVHPRARLRV
jgi:integrase